MQLQLGERQAHHGWSLVLGDPKLETDEADNVTLTMPGGRRTTFLFGGARFPFPFDFLLAPTFIPEAGVFGSLTLDGCGLLVMNAGRLVCFLEGGLDFAPTTYTYTDQYGTALTVAASGKLQSVTDRSGKDKDPDRWKLKRNAVTRAVTERSGAGSRYPGQ